MRRSPQHDGHEGMQEANAPHHTDWTPHQWHVPRIANSSITHVLPMRQWIAPHIRCQQVQPRLLLQASHPKPKLSQQVHCPAVRALPLPPRIPEDSHWNTPPEVWTPNHHDLGLRMPRHAQQWTPCHMLQRILPRRHPLRMPPRIREEAQPLPGLVAMLTLDPPHRTPRIQYVLAKARPQQPCMQLLQPLPLRRCVQQLHDQDDLRQDVL